MILLFVPAIIIIAITVILIAYYLHSLNFYSGVAIVGIGVFLECQFFFYTTPFSNISLTPLQLNLAYQIILWLSIIFAFIGFFKYRKIPGKESSSAKVVLGLAIANFIVFYLFFILLAGLAGGALS